MATDSASPPSEFPKLQAGGGVVSAVKRIDYVSPTVLQHLKTIVETPRALDEEQLQIILGPHETLKDASPTAGSRLELKGLLDYMTSVNADAMLPAPTLDCSHPLSNYYISSSHNSYLQGNQLWGEASAEVYGDILRRGCRCVEIDVWNGQDKDEVPEEGQAESSKRGLKTLLSKGIGRLDKLRKKSPSRSRPQAADAVPHDPKKLAVPAPDELKRPTPWRSASSLSRAEPRVLHGHTLTKEVSFREVCQSIGNAAFAISDLPVIVSLEVHADAEQQEMMVDIMKEVWHEKLVQPLSEECSTLPTLADVKHKILVKVKAGSKPAAADTIKKLEPPAAEESSSSESSSDEKGRQSSGHKNNKKKKSTITEALGSMGTYTRGYHFKNFAAPEAKIPTHVFALSEKKLIDVSEKHGPQLLAHNQQFMMRAYPSGARLTSTNYDPSVYWRMGVQIAALNWQRFDAGIMVNEGNFAGTGGWTLKPPSYRPVGQVKSDPSSKAAASVPTHHSLKLAIDLLAAQGLPLGRERSRAEDLRPYVKCMLHIEKGKAHEHEHVEKGKKNKEKLKWRSKLARGDNPDFHGECVDFDSIQATEALSFIRYDLAFFASVKPFVVQGPIAETATRRAGAHRLFLPLPPSKELIPRWDRFKVQDDVPGRDALLAWACIRLDRLRPGIRFVHLLNSQGIACPGVLLVKVTKVIGP